ncbi:collagen-binding domain-containing protein [Tropicimonas sp. IMCC34043]|uniref:collagen-binding domain-containing protein n=1 Tax=Tropicimonas sp. IMCC34043 TaxID=2248760 RepID=UPI00130086B2|nr:collagen-binding domain-containing protein [Tropicimonas sp. IMCC34043]
MRLARTAATLFVIVPALFAPLDIHAASLNVSAGFGSIIVADLTASGCETEARLAVGGTARANASDSVGGCIFPDRAGRVVPASLQLGSYEAGADPMYDDATARPATPASDADGDISNTLRDTAGKVSALLDFLSAGVTLYRDSANRSWLIVDAERIESFATEENWQIAISFTDADLNIFTLSPAHLGSASYAMARVIGFLGDSLALYNVPGGAPRPLTGTMKFGGADCHYSQTSLTCLEMSARGPKALVRYYQATTVTLSSFEYHGVAMAPYWTLTVEGGTIDPPTIRAALAKSKWVRIGLKPPHWKNPWLSRLLAAMPKPQKPARPVPAVTMLSKRPTQFPFRFPGRTVKTWNPRSISSSLP